MASANQAAAQAGPGTVGPEGVYRIGNGVSGPILIFKVNPEYSETARNLRASGTVLLHIVVQPDGTARDFKVLGSFGYGLDEKAIEAVRKWRFNPGMKDGKAVPVEAQIEEHFRMLVREGEADTWYSGPMGFASEAGMAPPAVKDGTMPKPASEDSNESVVLEFTVDSRGSVKNIHSIYGSESASKLLTPYLATWTFRPAVKDNRSVETTGQVRFVKGQGDEASKLALTPPLTRSNPVPPTGAPQSAGAREKKVKDLGEYNIYRAALQDQNGAKKIEDLNTWKREYPDSDYKIDREYLYLMAYQLTKQFDKELEKAKELMGQNLEVLFSQPQQVRTVLLSAMSALRSIENPTPDQFATAKRASEQLEAYNRKQGGVSDAANQGFAPATSAPPVDSGRTRTIVNPTDGQKYVWIPPGAFTMGCSPGDTECAGDEKPPHTERIARGFWLGQTEVTQAAYQSVNGGNPSTHKGDQLPVESLTWNHAANYCTAIGGRLPTEAEWEYAARAGISWARYGSLDEVAWHSGNSGGTIHPVAMKTQNAFGLYDMLGNVWEYVADSYAGSLDKILRGGAWRFDSTNARASRRLRSEPSGSGPARGFRCAGDWPAADATEPVPTAGARSEAANPAVGAVPNAKTNDPPDPILRVSPPAAGARDATVNQMVNSPGPQSQAADVLSRVRQTYTHLDAIHVVAKLSGRTIVSAQSILESEVEYELATKRPGSFRARSKSSTLEALSVSDGSNTWKALPKAKQWAKLDAGALGETGDEDRGVKVPQDFPHSIASILVSRYPAIAKQAEASEILREDTYAVSGRKVGCYVLRTRIKETEYEFWIDKERYLVLRDEETGTRRTQFGTGKFKDDLKVSEIETGSDVEESLFKFEPDRKWAETETIVLPSEKPPLLVGRPAPDFTLKSVDGGQVRLSSLRGKVVVLDFWATWCGPCRVELPILEKLRTEFGADVQFLGINDEEAGTARGFRKSHDYEMTVLTDSKREVSHQYGVQGIPTLLVIDSHGIVRQHWLGGRGERELRTAIQAASKL